MDRHPSEIQKIKQDRISIETYHVKPLKLGRTLSGNNTKTLLAHDQSMGSINMSFVCGRSHAVLEFG